MVFEKEIAMIKTLLVAAAAVMSLAGCVAVPYSGPATVVYAPPVSFSFGFSSYGGGHGSRYGHGGRRGYRH